MIIFIVEEHRVCSIWCR